MKLVIQRVNHASVKIDGQVNGEIENGFMILVGSEKNDNQATVDYLANKIAKLRVFEDENGKMNLNIHQVEGEILSVSQFTLLAELEHGNRPSFKAAGDPSEAKKMYEAFNLALENENLKVETGVFGADMQVDLENDGPATFELNYQVK
ncbi:D-aminoacyl-tRNA deacylase [Fructilactobacillus sanfranciscensis]|uniref:D-aminoacyl-tRNA deacylase n=1 Tax=Fructilactobacillus sanfranciscensis TaxID=1625 RepID=UPI0006EED549|nr:D-aminoacyl-tRNA deacylase [Fructilactobacillus sanfranciscensis]KRM80769.1 D-tyrosyl-tRNA(Tyr) deacylase [Fructilactobacillus sanfranciscensis DSM 20451]POH21383.1 D-tyrosyl-tRNA(Tyr) deacylase [Fructilactobacillus sanfranciscensis DSM 20451]QFX94015.1 D-tyrosyl-tRNA(Tyr) deacylase [Fructilactobacillus sanfranciscensis]RDX59047.1 D-tyrosyl-tRNA(Tyr) deacylase [Fructilactobacillus sanfranciscensis]